MSLQGSYCAAMRVFKPRDCSCCGLPDVAVSFYAPRRTLLSFSCRCRVMRNWRGSCKLSCMPRTPQRGCARTTRGTQSLSRCFRINMKMQEGVAEEGVEGTEQGEGGVDDVVESVCWEILLTDCIQSVLASHACTACWHSQCQQ